MYICAADNIMYMSSADVNMYHVQYYELVKFCKRH